jgi:hypothetical protein
VYSTEDFNIDLKKFNLVEEKSAIRNKFINNLFDEHEYLYKKR